MKSIRIGRGSANDVNLNDPQVSRSHCQIIQDDNGNYKIIDLNSSNGTFVNGARVYGEYPLKSSDSVRVGNTNLSWQSYFGNTRKTERFGGGKTSPANGGGNNNIFVFQQPNNNPYPPVNNYGDEVPPRVKPPKPNSFLVWAILSTLFCCLPFGIVSIVYASKVDGLWVAGDYDGAEEAASKARTWFWWSFGTAIALWIVYILFYAILGYAAFGGY